MLCPECGLEQCAGHRFCEDCGARLEVPDQSAAAGRTRLETNLAPHLAGVSDPGPLHDHNEDFAALTSGGGCDVLVVCDGVSNSQNPGAAAEAAAVAACEALGAGALGLDAMKAAINAAQVAVAAVPRESGAALDPPETTLVAAMRVGHEIVLGWLGDSRAYYVGSTGARLLTQDHSWVNEVVAAGTMTLAEARKAPLAHAVTRTVGGPHTDEPSLRTFEAPGGPGWLLLCTDGFWNLAAEPGRVAELVNRKRAGDDALSLARELVRYACDSRGRDNITVAALRLGMGQGEISE